MIKTIDKPQAKPIEKPINKVLAKPVDLKKEKISAKTTLRVKLLEMVKGQNFIASKKVSEGKGK